MRGADTLIECLFTIKTGEAFVPSSYPLRALLQAPYSICSELQLIGRDALVPFFNEVLKQADKNKRLDKAHEFRADG
jgi:hypothetical protein